MVVCRRATSSSSSKCSTVPTVAPRFDPSLTCVTCRSDGLAELPQRRRCWLADLASSKSGQNCEDFFALCETRAFLQISRTWIVYNRPDKLNHTHGGFLFALGLQGHLSALA